MDEIRKAKLRDEMRDLLIEYHKIAHAKGKFEPGKSKINYAGRVFDEKEMLASLDTLLEFYLTLGGRGAQFEREISQILGLKYGVLTNSGSSANLLAVSAACSWMYSRRLHAGDEVITVAAGFPTTVNPMIQNNLVPVFVDVELGSYAIDISKLEAAVSDKTRAIMFAHTLGNPPDMQAITEFAAKHNLLLIEDCCDALGGKFDGKPLGSFGQMATFSFYPAHHITMGEGGAIATDTKLLDKILRSIRDWGRSCWCDPGKSNTCGVRFDFKIGGVPYDHKYIYDNIGYNLKPLEMQAAIGLEQLRKLPSFVEARKRNFKRLYEGMQKHSEAFMLPKWHKKAEVSWFGFPLTIRKESGFKIRELQLFLDGAGIESRRLFSGNLTKQPAYREAKYRISGGLENSDIVMENSFFLGVYPGIAEAECNYMLKKMGEFLKK
ncbi:MAG: lipopolysaccharide biosynthesis protein RfbH [Candidatus Micrarchaeota archaeon]